MASRQNKIDVVLEYIDIAEVEILKRWHEPTAKDILFLKLRNFVIT